MIRRTDRVRRRRPALLGSDHVHRPVDLGDPGRRPPQRQPLDQLDHLLAATGAPPRSARPERRKPGNPSAWYAASHLVAVRRRNPGPAGGLRQRHAS